jgi:hypothetical protein
VGRFEKEEGVVEVSFLTTLQRPVTGRFNSVGSTDTATSRLEVVTLKRG